jgi:hypothetical protein
MYINFQLLKKNNLEPSDIYFLAAIKQIEKEQLKNIPIEVIQRFESLGILTTVKGTKSEAESLKIRLNDKGKNLFKSFFAENSWTEDEEVLYSWLSKYYTDRGKEIGNPNRVKKLLKWFADETGVCKNNLIKLFIDFLQDDYVDESSKVLEFTLFYPKKFTTDKGKTIAYEAKPDIYDSWLFNHLQKNRERLEKTFEKIE